MEQRSHSASRPGRKTRIGRRTFVSVLVVGGLIFGSTTVMAQEPPGTDSAQTERQGPGPAKSRAGGFILENTMEILGVDQGQIVSTLAGGGTLADLAVEEGSSGDELVAALVDMVDARLDEAVTAGRINAEEAAEKLANATERITDAVFNQHHPGNQGKPMVKAQLWQAVLDFLDVNRGQVVSNFAQGNTLANLAVEQGSNGDALIDVLVAVVDGHLQQAVEEGVISEEEAGENLANAAARITMFVNSPHAPGQGNS